MNMTERQRFLATMRYQPRDRCPISDFGFWPETIDVWHEQGLPWHVTYANYDARYTDAFFGMDAYTGGPSPHVGLHPAFEWKVIEDRGDHEVVQQYDGVLVLRKKEMGSIPHHIANLLQDRESWEKHYKPRLNPDTPGRMPSEASRKAWYDADRPNPINLYGGSLFGWIRDWMGLENAALLVYDDPGLFEEMVVTLADCSYAQMERALATGAIFDACAFWEDMCYSGGPLLSPEHFKRYLVPQYQRLTDLLAKHGVDISWVDCDGRIDALAPLWLEAGVNCMFPIEVGTWGGDPVAFRKEYGRDMLLMGGFDKHILAHSKEAISAEVQRLTPLVEEGGFIPFADHRVPPDVPYENYLHYLREARRVWGRGTNLKPVEWEEGAVAAR